MAAACLKYHGLLVGGCVCGMMRSILQAWGREAPRVGGIEVKVHKVVVAESSITSPTLLMPRAGACIPILSLN
jgi:hypothetical protein